MQGTVTLHAGNGDVTCAEQQCYMRETGIDSNVTCEKQALPCAEQQCYMRETVTLHARNSYISCMFIEWHCACTGMHNACNMSKKRPNSLHVT